MSNVVSIAAAPGFKPVSEPVITYTYRDKNGKVCRKTRDWKLPETTAAISAWMGRYFERVASGYIPEGMDTAPIPISARIKVGRRVVAKWKLDSVTDFEPCGWRIDLKTGRRMA